LFKLAAVSGCSAPSAFSRIASARSNSGSARVFAHRLAQRGEVVQARGRLRMIGVRARLTELDGLLCGHDALSVLAVAQQSCGFAIERSHSLEYIDTLARCGVRQGQRCHASRHDGNRGSAQNQRTTSVADHVTPRRSQACRDLTGRPQCAASPATAGYRPDCGEFVLDANPYDAITKARERLYRKEVIAMSPQRPSVEDWNRLRLLLREASERLLELQEQLIALRCAMSPAEYRVVDQATKACIDRAVGR